MNVRIILGFLLMMLIQLQATAQRRIDKLPPQKQEKIESMHIAFITEKLDLTPDESKNFWPVYDEFMEKLKALQDRRPPKRIEDMTEKEADDYVQEMLHRQELEVQLKGNYYNRLKKIIGVKKVIRLKLAEDEFKLKLLQKMKERRNERRE